MPPPQSLTPVASASRPKVLLIDLPKAVEEALRGANFTVTSGSFGTPYKVAKTSIHERILVSHSNLDELAEHDVVVVDLAGPSASDFPFGEDPSQPGRFEVYVSQSSGVVDPRPFVMSLCRSKCDKVFTLGGVFIVLGMTGLKTQIVHRSFGEFGMPENTPIEYDLVDFLSALQDVSVRPINGREVVISPPPKEEFALQPLAELLARYLTGATYRCTIDSLDGTPQDGRHFFPLARNRHGETVAGVLAAKDGDTLRSLVLVLPILSDPASFLVDLLRSVLPDMLPKLFPDVEGARWVHRPPYELRRVLELHDEIEKIKAEAAREVHAREKSIVAAQASMGFFYELLRGIGDSLVAAVRQTLEVLGFTRVIDADKEINGVPAVLRREDLRIEDRSLVLLVEAKGVGGTPSDEDALQVRKYVAPYMKRMRHTDVQGLAVINHLRHIPALERDHHHLFRQELLDAARHDGVGLLTTWDLFRLARSFLALKWTHEQVADLFYGIGRIEPVPVHYELLGTVGHMWPKTPAVEICVTNGMLRRGDRIAFEQPVEFVEQEVESLQLDDVDVEDAAAGTKPTTLTNFTRNQLKEGVRVFRVVREPLTLSEVSPKAEG